MKNTKIKIIPKADQVKYLKEKGYQFDKGEEIEVPLSDISPNSHIKIDAPCDVCGDTINLELRRYLKAIQKNGFYCCAKCNGVKSKIAWNNRSEEKKKEMNEKRRTTNRAKYGYDYTTQVPEFKDKKIKTNLEKYDCINPSQNKEVRDRIRKNNMLKYGVDNYSKTQECKDKMRNHNLIKYGGPSPSSSPEIKAKIAATNISRFGVPYVSQNKEIRKKQLETLHRNGNISTSAQQEYLSKVLGLESNYMIDYYFVDLYDSDNNVILEYDGGGHNLSVKLHTMTEEEFQRRELIREKELRKKGYKIIRIISDKDILPMIDMIHLMYECALEYFDSTSHTWITYNLDNSTIRNAINLDSIPFDFGDLLPVNTQERRHIDELYKQEYLYCS